MKVKTFVCSDFYNKVYLVTDTDTLESFVIDPGFESADLIYEYAKSHDYKITKIINTHGHIDHIAEDIKLKELTGAKIYVHKDDLYLLEDPSSLLREIGYNITLPSVKPDYFLTDDEIITVGKLTFTVLHTPGHSPGGICLYQKEYKTLFCGDTIFAGGIGRTDLAGGDIHQLLNSIKTRIISLPEETILYPGHGSTTTVKKEIQHNMFLSDDFIDEDGY